MSSPTPLDSLPLPVITAEGNPVKRRIKDVGGARSLYFQYRQADFESNRQMARHQAMADGEAPYDQAARSRLGQDYLSNFNPNDLKGILDTSLASYTDLISADESFIEVFTTFGETEQRAEWSQTMSKHLSRSIRSWSRFYFQYAYIPHYFNLHGVGIGYFEDALNWQWSVTNLGFMKIARQTPACEDDIECAFTKAYVQPHKLMDIIQKGEASEAEGWNIAALKQALMNTTTNSVSLYSFTELEARWKDNDLVWGSNNPTISLIYSWVREMDGKYSIVVFTEDGTNNPSGNPEEFLCYKQGVYNNAQEAMVFFTRGIGTNGTYHSIRGLAADIFNSMQALMRLRNREVDIAFESGPMWQVEDDEALETANITPWGAGMLISRGVKPLNMTPPVLSNTLQPAINSLQQTIQQNIGTYTSSATAIPSQREMSAKEWSGRIEQLAQLSVTQINLFNQSMDRLCREIARRFTRKDYQRNESGGHFVHDWRQACIADGVPPEALYQIDHKQTRAARTIGFGSPAARRVALQNLMELWPQMDEFGKESLVRDLVAATTGWEKANVYTPAPSATARPPFDTAIADMQNSILKDGGTATIQPNENKRVHLQQHIGAMQEFVAAFEQAGQNPAMYQEIVPPLNSLYTHSVETLETYTGIDAGEFRQQLQQVGEILVNGTRHLQKYQEEQYRQQEEAAMEGMEEGQQPQGPSPEQQKAYQEQEKLTLDMQHKIVEFNVKLENMQKETDASIQRQNAEAAAKLAREDMALRAKILQDTASSQAQQGRAGIL